MNRAAATIAAGSWTAVMFGSGWVRLAGLVAAVPAVIAATPR